MLDYSINSNQKVDVYHETRYFTVQIIDKNSSPNKTLATNEQNGNKLSIVDLNKCESKIKTSLKTSKELISSQVDYNPNFEDKIISSSTIGHVSYSLYDPTTGAKLNIQDTCVDEPITVKVPIMEISNIDQVKNQDYISKGVNIYDKTSDFYNSRCFRYSFD